VTGQEAIEWIERHTTLHTTVSMLYVVDGYEVTLLWDGNPISPVFHGETLLEALNAARVGRLETEK